MVLFDIAKDTLHVMGVTSYTQEQRRQLVNQILNQQSDILNRGEYKIGHPYKTGYAEFPKKIAVITPYEFWYRFHCKNIIDASIKFYGEQIGISKDDFRRMEMEDGTSVFWFTLNSLDIGIRGHRFDEINILDAELSEYQWQIIQPTLF